VSEERSEVHCFRASLSEQDLERLWGASGRAVVGWSSVDQAVV